jgi:hypothetical protein
MTLTHRCRWILAGFLVIAGPSPAIAAPAKALNARPPLVQTRTLGELTATDSPAWPLVQQWLGDAPSAEVLAPNQMQADRALVALQVTVRSPLGAVVHRTGGILVDHGWLRILGSGSRRLPRALPDWNSNKSATDVGGRPTLLLVADDVLGGFFAINGGGLPGPTGNVFYFAPDSLQWEDLGMGHSAFMAWALSPKLGTFYSGMRWTGWETEVRAVAGDQGLSVYPPLWAKGPAIGQRSRRPVPVQELYDVAMVAREQLTK